MKMKSAKRNLVIAVIAVFVLSTSVLSRADAVTDWNAVMQATVATSNAFVQARSAAIVQLGVFEAVNSITGKYMPYLATISAPPGASSEAAAVAAAYRTLVTLYPGSA